MGPVLIEKKFVCVYRDFATIWIVKYGLIVHSRHQRRISRPIHEMVIGTYRCTCIFKTVVFMCSHWKKPLIYNLTGFGC